LLLLLQDLDVHPAITDLCVVLVVVRRQDVDLPTLPVLLAGGEASYIILHESEILRECAKLIAWDDGIHCSVSVLDATTASLVNSGGRVLQ